MSEPTQTVSPHLLPQKERRLALFALMCGTFIIGTSEFAMMGILPNVAESFHTSIGNASNMIAAYAFGVVIGGPIFAILCAKMARRTLLLIALAIFFLGNTGSVLSSNLFMAEAMRFITGIPHGAFLGVAALIGVAIMPPSHKGRAVGLVMSGISFAPVLGVPLCTYVTRYFSWKDIYGTLGVTAVIVGLLLLRFVPPVKSGQNLNAKAELGGLKNPQLLLTLLTGAVGFGGFFGAYTFLTAALKEVSGFSLAAITACQAIWGMGMFLGNYAAGAFADRNLNRTVIYSMVASILSLIGLSFFMSFKIPTVIFCFIVPMLCIMIAPALQMRLTQVAGNAQTLAASLHHSAFNVANAAGAILANAIVSSSLGLRAVGWGSASLTLAGLLCYLLTLKLSPKETP